MDRRLLQLNGLAILAVVCNHAAGWGFNSLIWWAHRYLPVSVPYYGLLGNPSYYGLLLMKELTVFAVPAFLCVSGVFIAYASRSGEMGLRGKSLRTRLIALLIPYFIWSAINFASDVIQGKVYSPIEYGKRLLFGQATGAYFFVPLLLQFFLLSPWLANWAKSKPGTLLVVSGIFQWGLITLPYLKYFNLTTFDSYAFLPTCFFLRWIFYFSLGLVVGFQPQIIKQDLLKPRRWMILIALGLIGALAVLETGLLYWQTKNDSWLGTPLTFFTSLYALSFLLAFFAFAQSNAWYARHLNQLGMKSYGIYLIHGLVLLYCARGIYHLAPAVLGHQIIFQPILVLFGVGIPILMMMFVSKMPLRRFHQYIFG